MCFCPPANSRSYAVGGTPAASAPGMHGLFAPPPPFPPFSHRNSRIVWMILTASCRDNDCPGQGGRERFGLWVLLWVQGRKSCRQVGRTKNNPTHDASLPAWGTRLVAARFEVRGDLGVGLGTPSIREDGKQRSGPSAYSFKRPPLPSFLPHTCPGLRCVFCT